MRLAAPCPHLPSIAEALFRVFLPVSRATLPFPRRRNLPRYTFPENQIRHASHAKTKGRRPIQPNQSTGQPSTGPARDEGISANEIQIVNDDKSLGPSQNLRRTLASLNRDDYFIIQVADKVHPRYAEHPEPESGTPDTRPRIPICKIIDKQSFRLSQLQKDKPKKNPSTMGKQIEINWAISQHDLNHRLDRMKDFLGQGRRVEVVFGKKRKGWMRRKEVTEEKAQALLCQIREAAKTVESSKEWKSMEGKAGGEGIMFFEAKKE
ncbi:MAG: hypothetical protein LQ352_000206 [Teloschistes flavicans]|nr:MAG: hypothetical protein LQ352_000206 [Teloschistes flavicans]